MSSPSIAMIGMATLDLTYSLDAYPESETETRTLGQKVVAGGLMGRAAVTTARLGHTPKLFATCGTGLMADLLRNELECEGVDATWQVAPQPSQHSVVLSSRADGSRTTIWTPQPFFPAAPIDELADFLSGVSIALLDATDPLLYHAAVDICDEMGIVTVLDTGSGRPWTHECLNRIDYVLASAKYTRKLSGLVGVEAASGLWREHCRSVLAITEGADGGAWATGPLISDAHRWETPSVDAIDSCGAGDVFHGAFACALAEGLDLADCFDFSARVAADSTTAVGNSAIRSPL